MQNTFYYWPYMHFILRNILLRGLTVEALLTFVVYKIEDGKNWKN
jgi:hypothetical protein